MPARLCSTRRTRYTKKLLASLPVPDPREQQQHRAHLHELLAQEA